MTMTIDCRSEEGKTIGLIDSIITAAHLLVERDLTHPEVIEALKDVSSDAEFLALLLMVTQFIPDHPKDEAADTAEAVPPDEWESIDWRIASWLLSGPGDERLLTNRDVPYGFSEVKEQLDALARMGFVRFYGGEITPISFEFWFDRLIRPFMGLDVIYDILALPASGSTRIDPGSRGAAETRRQLVLLKGLGHIEFLEELFPSNLFRITRVNRFSHIAGTTLVEIANWKGSGEKG